MTTAVVANGCSFIFGDGAQVGDECSGAFWDVEALGCGVEFGDIARMVFIVVYFHSSGVDMGFECVEGVWEIGKCERHEEFLRM